MAVTATRTRSRVFDRVNLVLAALAGTSLVFMVVIIAVGVVMRFLFAQPILGLNEIVQLTAVAVVMLALPYCTNVEAHVRVDVLDQAIGHEGRLAGDIVSRVLSIGALSVLVWRAGLKSLDALKYGDATNMLSIPIWPFYVLLTIGIAISALVLAVQLVGVVVVRGVQ